MLATTFLHMLQTLYTNYKVRLSDLTFFEDIMDTCVDLLNALCQKHNNMDMPYDNVVGFVDGHFQVLPLASIPHILHHKLAPEIPSPFQTPLASAQ